MNNIKQKRIDKGMKQKELAQHLGVARSAVAKWETGKSNPRFDQIPLITKVLECSSDELLGIEKTPVGNGQAWEGRYSNAEEKEIPRNEIRGGLYAFSGRQAKEKIQNRWCSARQDRVNHNLNTKRNEIADEEWDIGKMASDNTVKINPDDIPDEVYETACRILKTSVRRFFEMPGVKEDYEKWLVEYEKEQKLKGLNRWIR